MSNRPDPRRWWALGALVACMLVLGFDTTILSVALPAMSTRLGADTGQQQWMANSYLVVFAALMLPAGLLGDRYGRRRMLITGLTVFLGGSLLGTVADSPGQVIAARSVLGVGGALIMPLALSVLPALFPPEERTRAVGLVSAASALGMPLGPVVGGWLLDHYWWGSIFLINVPLALVGILACVFLLPETSAPSSPAVDPLSTGLAVTGLGAFVFALNEGPTRGWTSATVLGTLAASALLLASLVGRERGRSRPMLDLTLLRHRGFLWNTAAASLITFTFMGLLFVLPTYLQVVKGQDAFGTGLRILPMMGGLLVASRAAGPLVQRFGPRPVVTGALFVMAVAALLGSRTGVHDGYGWTALWLTLTGFGFGFGIIPAMDGALGALPRDRAGNGSGLLVTLRQVAGAVGIAALGSLTAGTYTHHLDTAGLPPTLAEAADASVGSAHQVAAELGSEALARSADAAYLHGMDLALLVAGIAATLAAMLTTTCLPDTRPGRSTSRDHAVVAEKTDA
ncbi:MFS transporter [Streptomyces olivoreticuli]|nr:MFS transporter [Streptomyces olivoreticuli]WKK26178.1 MFS transporter [Streptomyces olivoreticuli]